MRHVLVIALVKRLVKDFESNPAVQYRIHMTATYVWVVNGALAVGVFIFLPKLWAVASVLYLVLVSLYANFATDYGAVSAAEAAGTTPSPPEILLPKIEAQAELIAQQTALLLQIHGRLMPEEPTRGAIDA